MHPRSPFNARPDFTALSKAWPPLAQHVDVRGHVDFANPAALRELTCALLHVHFSLRMDLPLDRLIPPVPNRLNYVLWIEDLLGPSLPRPVTGIDIGLLHVVSSFISS